MNSTQTRNTDYCKFIESKTNIRLYFLRRIFVLHADICEIAFQHVKVILYGTSFLQYHKSDESFRQFSCHITFYASLGRYEKCFQRKWCEENILCLFCDLILWVNFVRIIIILKRAWIDNSKWLGKKSNLTRKKFEKFWNRQYGIRHPNFWYKT